MSDNKVNGVFQVSSAIPQYYQTTVSLSVPFWSSLHLLLGMIHSGCCVTAPPLTAGLSAISIPGATGNITQLPSSKTTSTCLEDTLTSLGVIIIPSIYKFKTGLIIRFFPRHFQIETSLFSQLTYSIVCD